MRRRVHIDSSTAQLGTRIPSSLHHAVKLAAFESDVPLCEWVADALTAHLQKSTGTAADRNAPESSGDALRRPAKARA